MDFTSKLASFDPDARQALTVTADGEQSVADDKHLEAEEQIRNKQTGTAHETCFVDNHKDTNRNIDEIIKLDESHRKGNVEKALSVGRLDIECVLNSRSRDYEYWKGGGIRDSGVLTDLDFGEELEELENDSDDFIEETLNQLHGSLESSSVASQIDSCDTDTTRDIGTITGKS